jgi:hypothetical protein
MQGRAIVDDSTRDGEVIPQPVAQGVEQGSGQQQSRKGLEPRTESRLVKIQWGFAGVSAAVLCAGFAWTPASTQPAPPVSLTAQQPKDAKQKPKKRSLHWGPPDVDVPLRSRILLPPCVLPNILEQSAARANEMVTNLENFTAQEKIEYQGFDSMGRLQDGGAGTFDYVIVFEQQPEGLSVKESRTPTHGSHFPAGSEDIRLPEMALIFLVDMQSDYQMRCEGTTEWNGQPTWVVHFQQRRDRPGHTLTFRSGDTVYPAMLKGRAWIATDSGEVMHIETSLLGNIPATNVRNWYFSIDYAPVQFHAHNVRIWLPQTVEAYCDFDDRRTIVYHTFTNFMLFSIHTDQMIEKPKDR